MTKKLRLLLVDDDPLILDVLQLTMQCESDLETVGSLTDTQNLLGEVACRRPDIILLDLGMSGGNPMLSIKEMSEAFPESRLIIHTGVIDHGTINRLMKAGAWGYVCKGLPRRDLLRTIREVADGQRPCIRW